MNSYIENQFNRATDDNINLYAIKIMSDKDSTHWISIKKDDLPALIELFIAEQKTFDKKYSGFSDCIKHFTYWLPNNIKKLTTQTPTTVKSKGKILGI